ncbi:mRNA export factor [Nematocida sp. LUAm3]|nr:mRNA export factor [Nematocida sp. LUAm3]KAI5175802.1 mRNA export factor [Nematocida sp. LUAm2]KAI5178298.1 mRNA export factor [Nematocida sp. LUAm1]
MYAGGAFSKTPASTVNLLEAKLAAAPTDTISCLLFSPTADILCAGSWDGSIYIYIPNIPGSKEMQLKTSIPNANNSPILCSACTHDGKFFFFGCADGRVKILDMSTGSGSDFLAHTTGIGSICYTVTGALVTAGWDKTIKFWTPSNNYGPLSLHAEYKLDSKVASMETNTSRIVVCLVDNKVITYDAYKYTVVSVNQENSSYNRSAYMSSTNKYRPGGMVGSFGSHSSQASKYHSMLNWQPRTIAMDAGGIALIGAIDGRVEILQYPVDDMQTSSMPMSNMAYTFNSQSSQSTNALAYAVNKVLFHPIFNKNIIVCTAEGKYTIWDRLSKRKLYEGGPGNSWPISTAAIDKTGKLFAYAIGYDWSKGHLPQITVPIEIRVVSLSESILIK